MRVDAQRNLRSGLLLEHTQDISGRRSEDLDTRGGLQRLGVGLPGAVTDDPHMEFQGGSVRMDLDNCHLAVVLIDVLVEGDQPRLILLDEAGQPRDALLFSTEFAVPEPVGGDEDERSGHVAPSSLSCDWLPRSHGPPAPDDGRVRSPCRSQGYPVYSSRPGKAGARLRAHPTAA